MEKINETFVVDFMEILDFVAKKYGYDGTLSLWNKYFNGFTIVNYEEILTIHKEASEMFLANRLDAIIAENEKIKSENIELLMSIHETVETNKKQLDSLMDLFNSPKTISFGTVCKSCDQAQCNCDMAANKIYFTKNQ